jgi:EmrB/QacA subfamily drug resistance transporter
VSAPTPAPATPAPYARRWWMLGVLCLSLLIVFVGNSSLNVAIPTLSRDLHASESQLQWVVASYSLVFAGLLFSTGAFGDRFGRKGALQLGLVGFLLGALLAAASSSMWELIACRALMGASAAFIMPSTLSILVNVFPADERAKAIAIWAATTGAAGAIGPVASGWLLGHFWYGSIFLINVPIIVVALASGWVLIPKSRDPEQARLDPVGAVLSVIGISSLVYALIQAPEQGWLGAGTLLAFGVALVILALFVAWELRVEEPMLDMRFFRNPAFSTGTGGMVLVFLAMFGVMFLITQYFQLVLDYSPLSAAVRLLPMAPIMIIVAPMTPRLSTRFGAHRVVASGMLLITAGLLMFRALDLHTAYLYVLVSLVPLVSGMALAMSPMTAAIMSAVPPRRAGAGSAMNDATRELGAALGVAVLGSLASSRYGSALAPSLKGLSPAARSASRASIAGALRTAAALPRGAARTLTLASQHAFVDGIHLAVAVGALLAAVSAVLVLRYLPHQLAPEGALHGPVEAMEDVAELGLAGVPPVFADGDGDEGAGLPETTAERSRTCPPRPRSWGSRSARPGLTSHGAPGSPLARRRASCRPRQSPV